MYAMNIIQPYQVLNKAGQKEYRQVSNIRRTKSQHLKDSRTVLQLAVFAESLEARC